MNLETTVGEGDERWDAIAKKVTKTMTNNLGIDKTKIDYNANFDDLGMDSLDRVEFIMALEEEYDFSIPNEEADNISSVRETIIDNCVT